MTTDTVSNRWLVFAVTALGTFMSNLDSSIVNVAMPIITQELSASVDQAQWVVTAYLLTITSLLLIFGKLGDMAGRRRVYVTGFLTFTVGSVLCAMSHTIAVLIAARVVQAAGAAMLMANAPAIITLTFPAEGRGRALGMTGAAVALGSLTGPALGGILVGWFGWESVFTINLPIGLAATILAWRILPRDEGSGQASFDVIGAILFAVSVICLLLTVSFGQSRGWSSPEIMAGMAGTIVTGLGFVRHERKVCNPMLDLSIFKCWPFFAGSVSSLLSFMAGFSNVFLLPFFLASVLAYDAKLIGLLLTPLPLTMALTAPISGRLSEQYNTAVLTTVGLFVLMAGLWLQAGLNEHSSFARVALGQVVLGLGNGIFHSPNNNSVMSSVPRDKVGIAGGVSALVRNLGMVLGVAIAVAVFESLRLANSELGEIAAIKTGYRFALLTGSAFALAGALLSMSRNK